MEMIFEILIFTIFGDFLNFKLAAQISRPAGFF